MSETMGDIEMLVFVHGHYQTGKPIEIDIIKIKGLVDLEWLREIVKDRGEDAAKLLYKHLKRVNDCAWFKVSPVVEVGDYFQTAFYYQVIGLVNPCNQ